MPDNSVLEAVIGIILDASDLPQSKHDILNYLMAFIRMDIIKQRFSAFHDAA